MASIAYTAKRSLIYTLGKDMLMLLNGGKAITVTNGVSGVFAGLGTSVGVLALLGATTAFSAGMTQMDFYEKKKNLKYLYKEELAAQAHTPEGKLGEKELYAVAEGDAAHGIEGNRVIKEAIDKGKKQRNFGIALSAIASLAAFAAVGYIGPHLFAEGAVKTIGQHVVKLVVEGAIGLAAYNAVKAPLHWMADKIFGLDERITHDRIADIAGDRDAGKEISREQVLAVFAGAHPELDAMIENTYGKTFDALKLADKQRATQDLAPLLHIDSLTRDINQGKVNVTELAFAVDGKASGVEHDSAHMKQQHGLIYAMLGKMRSAVGRVAGLAVHHPVKAESVTVVIDAAEQKPAKSFVERLGRDSRQASVSYVEQVTSQPMGVVAER